MRTVGHPPQWRILRTQGRDAAEPGADAPYRREEPPAPLAGRPADHHMAAKGHGTRGQQKARRAAFPFDGPIGHRAEPQYLEAGERGAAQNL